MLTFDLPDVHPLFCILVVDGIVVVVYISPALPEHTCCIRFSLQMLCPRVAGEVILHSHNMSPTRQLFASLWPTEVNKDFVRTYLTRETCVDIGHSPSVAFGHRKARKKWTEDAKRLKTAAVYSVLAQGEGA